MWNFFIAGGPVMWPLLICSVAALAVVLERAWFWRGFNLARDREAVERLLEDFRREGKFRQDRENAHEQPGEPLRAGESGQSAQSVQSGRSGQPGNCQGAVMRMLISGLSHRDYSLSRAMESEALDEIQKMRRGMGILDTIITAAPMLGILGTVTGIIASFDMLSQSGVNDPHAVVGGIAQALISTAAGLMISIAALFPFNYFNSRIEHARDTFENYATRLEMLQEKAERGAR